MKTFISILTTALLFAGCEPYAKVSTNAKVAVQPAVFISSPAMSYFYVGVDNPVSITVPGYTNDQLSVSGCGIRRINNDMYFASPTIPGEDYINVYIDVLNETIRKSFRVRRVPDPYIYLGNVKGNLLHLNEFQNANTIDIKNPDFPFALTYELLSFEMIYVPIDGSRIIESSDGKIFTEKMEEIKKSAKQNDIIIITALIKMPDARTVPINSSYKLN